MARLDRGGTADGEGLGAPEYPARALSARSGHAPLSRCFPLQGLPNSLDACVVSEQNAPPTCGKSPPPIDKLTEGESSCADYVDFCSRLPRWCRSVPARFERSRLRS